MPITISYNNFITPTGSMSIATGIPGSFSPIYSGINNLDADDRTIIFSNLPSGLRVISAQNTTPPFDSVYIDIVQYDDYAYVSGGASLWSGVGGGSNLLAAYTSGGFWALGNPEYGSPGVILTGSGDENSSILDIAFEGINLQETTFDTPDSNPINLLKARSYIFQGGSGDFPNIIFDQTENFPWYAVQVNSSNDILISGTSYEGSGSTIQINGNNSVYWSNNELTSNIDALTAPEPFGLDAFFSEGFSWNGTYANENFSSYTVLSSNAGNTGTAVIQLNATATNGEQFTDLILPLRKLYVTFTDNP